MATTRSRDTAMRISREAREHFLAAAEGAIAEAGNGIQERLTSLADLAGNAREMQMHRDDLIAFRSQHADWVTQAQAAWREAAAGRGVSGIGPSTVINSLSQLELMGDDTVENNILSSRLSLQIQEKASSELSDLRLRMQHLDQVRELDSRDVLRPDTPRSCLSRSGSRWV